MNDSNLTNSLMKVVLECSSDTKKGEALRILKGEQNLQPAHVISEPYLTLKSIAEALGFHPCTLWRWGCVPSHSFGGRKRYLLSEVSVYLESDEFKKRIDVLRAERRQTKNNK